jgi:thioredoxin reductase
VRQYPVAVIGAGPYGLSVAAHLLVRGIPTVVFGKTMAFWERMPDGMFLKSVWSASSIADPQGQYSLDHYVATTGYRRQEPIPLPHFVKYGRWMQANTVAEVDSTLVRLLSRDGELFRLELDDGRSLTVASVIVATGIASFAYLPDFAHDLPEALVTHTQEHKEFSEFSGKRVVVLGRGQSAVQTAAFLCEAGADVEVIARGPIIWIQRKLYERGGIARHIFYSPSDVGPPGLNWIIHFPSLYFQLPQELRARIDQRATRPAGAKWLRSRVEGQLVVTAGTEIVEACTESNWLRLTLGDGATRIVDHLFAATGYHPDIDRLTFIDPVLREQVRRWKSFPLLDTGFESSVPGLFFVGAISSYNFGPLTRFVAGAGVAARHIAKKLASAARRPEIRATRSLTPVHQ